MSQRIPGPVTLNPLGFAFPLRRDPTGFFTQLAKNYGPVAAFRMGMGRYVSIVEPELIREVLVTKDNSFMKSPALRRAKVTLGEGLLTSEGDFHKRQRRLSQPAFHAQRVRSYAAVMAEYARETSDSWQDGQRVDAHKAMMALTLRVVAKTLFDADLAAEVATIGHAMDISVAMFTRATSPWGPILDALPLPSNYRFLRAYALLCTTIDRFILERRQSGIDRGDLLSMLLAAQDVDGTGMSDRQLRDECITLFTAGHETTANALTFTLHLLSHHPAVWKQFVDEVDGVLQGRLPTEADVERLPFVRAVFAESMRLYPPAWIMGRQPKHDVRIGDFDLPASTVVILSQWVVHHDPRWWQEPLLFDPSRWSREAPERPRYGYFPFGGGSRSCIGEAFAWMEGIIILATLAQRYEFLPTGPANIPLTATITLRPAGPLYLTLRRRN